MKNLMNLLNFYLSLEHIAACYGSRDAQRAMQFTTKLDFTPFLCRIAIGLSWWVNLLTKDNLIRPTRRG